MAIETVQVALVTDAVVPAALDGVVVRVFDADGELVTMAISGDPELGQVSFELEGDEEPVEYQLRFAYPGSAISPKRIEVYSPASLSPTGTNTFQVSAAVFELEPAVDPLLCRASGIVTGPSGQPRAGVDVTFIPKFHAFVEGNTVALPGRFVVRTNKQGFMSVDLYRYAMYEVTIAGREEVVRNIEVPNRSSIPLPHLLFPVVVLVAYAEAGPYTVPSGGRLQLTPTVRASNFQELGLGADDVLYSILDPAIASVQLSGDRIVIHGHAPGMTTLRVTRLDKSIVYLPDPGIVGGDLPIVVT